MSFQLYPVSTLDTPGFKAPIYTPDSNWTNFAHFRQTVNASKHPIGPTIPTLFTIYTPDRGFYHLVMVCKFIFLRSPTFHLLMVYKFPKITYHSQLIHLISPNFYSPQPILPRNSLPQAKKTPEQSTALKSSFFHWYIPNSLSAVTACL